MKRRYLYLIGFTFFFLVGCVSDKDAKTINLWFNKPLTSANMGELCLVVFAAAWFFSRDCKCK